MIFPLRIFALKAALVLQVLFVIWLVYYGRRLEEASNYCWGMLRPYSVDPIWIILSITIASVAAYIVFGCKLIMRRGGAPSSAFLMVSALVILVIIVLAALRSYLAVPAEWVHLITYGLIAATLRAILLRDPQFTLFASPALRICAILGFALLLSLVDEGLQALHPARVFDIRDINLNLLGTILALVLTEPIWSVSQKDSSFSGIQPNPGNSC